MHRIITAGVLSPRMALRSVEELDCGQLDRRAFTLQLLHLRTTKTFHMLSFHPLVELHKYPEVDAFHCMAKRLTCQTDSVPQAGIARLVHLYLHYTARSEKGRFAVSGDRFHSKAKQPETP